MIESTIFPYESETDIQNYWSEIQNVYSHIVDEKSKKIYTCRLLLSLTGDVRYVRELVLCTEEGQNLEEYLGKQKTIYIYGAGIRGKRLIHMFPNMRWKC